VPAGLYAFLALGVQIEAGAEDLEHVIGLAASVLSRRDGR
jgi:hypothetical protein